MLLNSVECCFPSVILLPNLWLVILSCWNCRSPHLNLIYSFLNFPFRRSESGEIWYFPWLQYPKLSKWAPSLTEEQRMKGKQHPSLRAKGRLTWLQWSSLWGTSPSGFCSAQWLQILDVGWQQPGGKRSVQPWNLRTGTQSAAHPYPLVISYLLYQQLNCLSENNHNQRILVEEPHRYS